jgi:glycosyltransferase involved in cell wall biosynthesis
MSEVKICLSIIVKNEEAVIERLLNTVWPILDHYIVVDTGSTDNTKQIVEDFFKSKGIPGKVVDHEWNGFGDARMFAYEQSKLTGCSHSFWIDADEQLIIEDNFQIAALKQGLSQCGSATIEVEYGLTTYTRNQFWSNTEDFYWYGPVHEVLMCDKPTKPTGFIKGIRTLVTADGASWMNQTQQQKYEKDAALLLDYVKNDPKKDPRWVFYLGQSYRDAVAPENLVESIKWYGERAKMNTGYPEERYYSQLMVASLKGKLNEMHTRGLWPTRYPNGEVIDDFLKCADFEKSRVEHYIPLIKFYQAEQRWESAYVLSSYCMKNFHRKSPYPRLGLFIDGESYSWKIADVHAISCWYSGRKDESKKAMNQVMKAVGKNEVRSQADVARIKNNLQFYKSGGVKPQNNPNAQTIRI